MQEQIFDLLLNQEDVTWKTLLYDLVKTEQMDPWDVNITLLTQKYIAVIKKMQELDLRISGKILLAAAFLLKIKSSHLVDNDFAKLDALLNPDEGEDDFFEEFINENGQRIRQKYHLIPKNPQPRNRKVSIHDLVKALQQAMATKRRILNQQRPINFEMPKKGIDILGVIRDLYHKITYYTTKEEGKELTFTKLLPPRAGKKEKVYTFIPLLHLENEQKVETSQKQAFDEIYVKLKKSPSA